MEPSTGGGERPTAEEVISKLKDDGDFDALRLKIVRKLKENEDLRNQIISEVKQSAALNREGAENMKPRQLSDAIHEEIGNKIMGQISDEIWKIIRSSDGNHGMKEEIRESVNFVYNKLTNPQEEGKDAFSSPRNLTSNAGEIVSQAATSHEIAMQSEGEPIGPPGFAPCIQVSQAATSSCEIGMQSEKEPQGPPGFAPCLKVPVDNCSKEEHGLRKGKQPLDHYKEVKHGSLASLPMNDDGPPGFAHFQTTGCIAGAADEDPDVPPGFG